MVVRMRMGSREGEKGVEGSLEEAACEEVEVGAGKVVGYTLRSGGACHQVVHGCCC
jgi:hypothetical protein